MDDFHHLGADVLVRIVGHGHTKVLVAVHLYSRVYSLQKAFFVNALEDEAGFVERFGAFGGCADADSGERMAHAGEEATLFGECA